MKVRKVAYLAILAILEDSGLFNVVFWTRMTRNDQESVTLTPETPVKRLVNRHFRQESSPSDINPGIVTFASFLSPRD